MKEGAVDRTRTVSGACTHDGLSRCDWLPWRSPRRVRCCASGARADARGRDASGPPRRGAVGRGARAAPPDLCFLQRVRGSFCLRAGRFRQ